MKKNSSSPFNLAESQLQKQPHDPISSDLRQRVMCAVRAELDASINRHTRQGGWRSGAVLVATVLSLICGVFILSRHRHDARQAPSLSETDRSFEFESLPTVQEFRLALWVSPDKVDQLVERHAQRLHESSSANTLTAGPTGESGSTLDRIETRHTTDLESIK